MASEALIKVVEEQDALEQASDEIQTLVTGAFKSAGPAGREMKNFPQGTWLGFAVLGYAVSSAAAYIGGHRGAGDAEGVRRCRATKN